MHELSLLWFVATSGLGVLRQNIFAFRVAYVASISSLLKLQSPVLYLPSIISAGDGSVILLLTVQCKEAEESRFS